MENNNESFTKTTNLSPEECANKDYTNKTIFTKDDQIDPQAKDFVLHYEKLLKARATNQYRKKIGVFGVLLMVSANILYISNAL